MDSELPANQRFNKVQQEFRKIQLQQRTILENIHSGVILLDGNDSITDINNSAFALWGLPHASLGGLKIQETDFATSGQELLQRLHSTHSSMAAVTFKCRMASNEKILSVTLRAIATPEGERQGALIYIEDITDQTKLQGTVEQLEAASQALQSSNEELENANEELQSANEELETTNQELQSVNEELETMNEELEARTRELHTLTDRYVETLHSMPLPIIVVDPEERVRLWNAAAQRLFGIDAISVVGVSMIHIPMELKLRSALLRCCKTVLESRSSSVLRNQEFKSNGSKMNFDVQFAPILRQTRPEEPVEGVLVMFGPFQGSDGEKRPGGKKSTPRKTEPKRKAGKSLK
jgi:PAS domain S-box-containing protein